MAVTAQMRLKLTGKNYPSGLHDFLSHSGTDWRLTDMDGDPSVNLFDELRVNGFEIVCVHGQDVRLTLHVPLKELELEGLELGDDDECGAGVKVG